MKAKFKETLERCDNLEQRLGEITKDKQSIDKKYVSSSSLLVLCLFTGLDPPLYSN